jgi:hypothetical protein
MNNGEVVTARVPEIPVHLGGELWGITACFNPAGYRNKYDHLRRFASNVRRQGLKLVIVELCLRGAASVLQDDAADLVIRLRSDTILWHKERLLNIALSALPDCCDKVAWLDADLLFENAGWVRDTARLLDRYSIVQPFQFACWLPQNMAEIPTGDSTNGTEIEVQAASAYAWLSSKDWNAVPGHPGFAWAARRSLLSKHGFYDRFILGGGDWVMSWAMFHSANLWQALLPSALENHLRTWSADFHADVQGSVYFTPGRLFHLWHGDKKNRRYLLRSVILREANFDPTTDITLDDAQCWRWSSDKPELHRKVEEYFRFRKEEG